MSVSTGSIRAQETTVYVKTGSLWSFKGSRTQAIGVIGTYPHESLSKQYPFCSKYTRNWIRWTPCAPPRLQ